MPYEVAIRLTVDEMDDAYDIVRELNHPENTGLPTNDAEIISLVKQDD